MIVYFLHTYNYLHRSKKIFTSQQDLRNYIFKILNMNSKKLNIQEIESSLHVISFNSKKIPFFRKIFKECNIISPLDNEEKKEKTYDSYKYIKK